MTLHQAFARGTRYLLARNAGLCRTYRRAKRRRIAILTYHGVTDQPLPVYNWCHMPVREFAEQMAFLAATYRPLPLSEVVRRLAAGSPLPDFTACVTFDDGFLNNLTNALPVLKQHGIPCTVFMSTALPDTGQPPWPEQVFSAIVHARRPSILIGGKTFPLASSADRLTAYDALMRVLKSLPPAEREAEQCSALRHLDAGPADPVFATMTWSELSEFAKNDLVRIGSHTHTHEILTSCTPERQRDELARSRNILREKLGYCDMLAYPNGDHAQDIRKISRELGYLAAVTTRHRLVSPGDDLFALDRLGIGAGWPLRKFEVKILGY